MKEKKRKEKKRKSRDFLKEVIKSTEREIKVLMFRLEEEGPDSSCEGRVCCLMNRTLPKIKNNLAALENEEQKAAWFK